MTEPGYPAFRQPSEKVAPTILDILDVSGVYTCDDLPLSADRISDYDYAGGLRQEPYRRGDSPSRDSAGLPYNATWFDNLRRNYGAALDLLEELRQSHAAAFSADTTTSPEEKLMEVYYMGIQLPNFLLWRSDNPYRNGELPAAPAVLRQALLGVGNVLVRTPIEQLGSLTGQDIVDEAEKKGDLVIVPEAAGGLPAMVCPAPPAMIRGLGQALLHGNVERGQDSLLLDTYTVDVRTLRSFALNIEEYHRQRTELYEQVLAISRQPALFTPSAFEPPKSRSERYDEIMRQYCDVLNAQQVRLYDILGRTGRPRPMTLERLYKYDADIRTSRRYFKTG